MEEDYPSPLTKLRSALWIFALAFVVILSALNYSFFVDVLRVLADPAFLRGFGNLLLISVMASMIGGGLGVAVGKLVELADWLSRSTIRLLRLGMWLPFFVFWALPIWRPGTGKYSGVVVWLTTITLGVIAAGPTVLLASCYFHLSSRVLLKVEGRRLQLRMAPAVFLLALFISLLWQLFFPSIWPWKWLITGSISAASSAAVILVMAIVILTNLLSEWSFDRGQDAPTLIFMSGLHRRDSRSLAGALLVLVLALFLWQLSAPILKSFLSIEPPLAVGRAVHRLLVAGTEALHESRPTIWPDIRLSPQEIAGGLVLAGVTGIFAATAFKRSQGLVSLTYVTPVVLASQIILWVGIGIWQKILTIAFFSFFPFAQALWSYRNFTLPSRLLGAIDETLPYAFVGMVFSEAYAATGGLGFVILVAAAKGYIAEAIATALITFGLLAIISCLLRFVVKRLSFSEAEIKDVAPTAV
jgi:ABC-type nitrate/sulfonate/bicarbonate transport system permease component